MTEIRHKRNKTETEITVMGHCNAGRINGMDMCCCAVSMLVFTVLGYLSSLTLKNYKGDYSGGWCYIRFSNKCRDSFKAQIAIDMAMRGFKLLKEKYPSSINIIQDKKEMK